MSTRTRQSLAQPDLQFGNESQLPATARQKLDRLTQSVRALIDELQKVQQAMAGGSIGEVLEKTGAGDYEAAWGTAATGSITGAENIGPGDGLFASVEPGGVLAFKSLIQGEHVTLVEAADSITIAVDTGEGGIGTVTSVGINSADLEVDGTPITSAGSIELTIKPKAVTYAKMQDTTQDSIVLGRRAGDGVGELEELTAADLRTLIGQVGYPPQLGYAGI